MEKYLNEIKNRLAIFQDMYSHIRIVEPVERLSHIEVHEGQLTRITTDHCYKFWEASKQCENCISMRAYNTRASAVKIEIKDNITYLIQAFPVEIDDNLFIVEMLKDITENGIILAENQKDMNLHEYVKRMNAQLITDELTNVYNRRYLEERLPTDLYRAKLEGKSVSIVMADIDYFKNVNDTYGHVVGDCVLKKFAELVNTSIRESMDFMARYGGEEFIIVLNHSDKENAIKIVEKIRKKIESTVFECDGNNIKITCSFGINVVSDSTYDIKDVIAPADECLYLAKQNGRNQSMIL